MKRDLFNANLAGMIDGADYLVEGVENLLKAGSELEDKNGVKKLEVPPSYYEQLELARSCLQIVSNWLLNNEGIEHG